jgi:hypothetical protein
VVKWAVIVPSTFPQPCGTNLLTSLSITIDTFRIDQHAWYYQYYHRQLTAYLGNRLDPHLWQPMLEVGCLVEVMTKGIWHAFFACHHENEVFRADMRRSVNSYNALVRKATRWL